MQVMPQPTQMLLVVTEDAGLMQQLQQRLDSEAGAAPVLLCQMATSADLAERAAEHAWQACVVDLRVSTALTTAAWLTSFAPVLAWSESGLVDQAQYQALAQAGVHALLSPQIGGHDLRALLTTLAPQIGGGPASASATAWPVGAAPGWAGGTPTAGGLPPPAARLWSPRWRRRWLLAAVGGLLAFLLLAISLVGVTLLAPPQTGLGLKALLPPSVTRGTFPASATASETVVFANALTTPLPGWPMNASCAFQDGGYEVKAGGFCLLPLGALSNGSLSVQVQQRFGSATAFYGLFFRRAEKGDYYEWFINSNSEWVFAKVVGGQVVDLVSEQADPALRPGLTTSNSLLLQADGPQFHVVVNGRQMGVVADAQFAAGTLGFGSEGSATVVFTNLVLTASQ
jgi:hypothetical protein